MYQTASDFGSFARRILRQGEEITMNKKKIFACQIFTDKVKDDFPELAEKIKTAKALVIGGYIPYSQIDGFTKALLERFWSLRVAARNN